MVKMNAKYTAAFLFVIVASVNANGAGAPELACKDMKPQHGVDPKSTALPYNVTVSNDNIKQGERIKIKISEGTKKEFMGFLLQVREKDKPVGSFVIPSSDEFAQILQCDSKNVAATHKSKDIKNSVEVSWVAPGHFTGKLIVYASVATTATEFWAAHPTAEINVH